MCWKKTALSLICLSASSLLYSTDVATDDQLQQAIIDANGIGDKTINFTADIPLVSFGAPPQPLLRPLNTTDAFIPIAQTITINGNNFALDGTNTFRGFFVRGGSVVINNLIFTNALAKGGNGGFAGGALEEAPPLVMEVMEDLEVEEVEAEPDLAERSLWNLQALLQSKVQPHSLATQLWVVLPEAPMLVQALPMV